MNIIARIRVEWLEVEPTGLQCSLCGEAIWLKEWHLIARVNDGEPSSPILAACDACKGEVGRDGTTEDDK